MSVSGVSGFNGECGMTQLLEKAFQEASRRPVQHQDAIAALVLAELEFQQRWDKAFAESQDALASLASEALAEHRAGKTRPLDLEDL